MVQSLWNIVWRFHTKHTLKIQHVYSLVFIQMSYKIMSTAKCPWRCFSCFIHSCQTWMQPRCPSVGEWISKLLYRIVFNATKKWAIKPWKRHRQNLNFTLRGERSQSEKATHCIIPNMTFYKRQNCGNNKKADHREFLGQWDILYDTIMVEACHHTFIQTHIEHTIWEWNVEYGLWVIMTCRCRVIKCNKYDTLCTCSYPSVISASFQTFGLSPTRLLCSWNFSGNMGMGCHFLLQGIFPIQRLNPYLLCLLHCRQILYPLNHWGSPYHSMWGVLLVWEQRVYGNSPYQPLNFAVNLKLL